MDRLTISLPKEQRRYLQKTVAKGQYASESEVLRDMIRQRQREEAGQSLTAALVRGLEGDDVALTDKELTDIWKEARRKVKSGRPKK